MAFSTVPMPHEYMIVGIIGFFISIFIVADWSKTWSFALGLFFLLLVIASLVSLTTDNYDDTTLDIIAGEHYQERKRHTLKKR